MQADNALSLSVKRQNFAEVNVIIAHCKTVTGILHVMLKRRLNLSTAENNSESVDVLTHSITGTPGTVTCLPVAAVECLKLKR